MAQLSQAGINLILSHEGFDSSPSWPKASSGVTIGHGYDLGYVHVDEFAADWGTFLSSADFQLLIKTIGLTGQSAKAAIPAVKHIKITKSAAGQVFKKRSMPKAEFITRQAYPRSVELCDNAYSALVSLVFNRGASMTDPIGDPLQRRKEMREIRDTLASTTLSPSQRLNKIAASLRAMKRIWQGQGVAGLLRRREEEAALVETCL
jgi:GH24 family phage-related lysozyme (muramidase)